MVKERDCMVFFAGCRFILIYRALHQQVIDELRYEACKLLIETEAYQQLGRWDQLQFRTTLPEVLSKGSEDQMDIVAEYFAKRGNIDERIINQFRNGLGHLETERRNKSIEFYCSLNIEHADIVVPLMLNMGKEMNYKVRYDVVVILSSWIPRLLPPLPSPPAPRDPDALETDSEELVKALFHTLGTTSFENNESSGAISDTEEKSKNIKFGSIKSQPQSDPNPLPPISTKNADSCIELLLDLMWNDKNSDVKGIATRVLGELKQGKAVYDWIIRHFTSEEPMKRAQALRNIASLGMITRDDMPKYLATFKDSYGSVRIEACKLACVLRTKERDIIHCLLDLLDDCDFKVRAYAIKALGRCSSKELKNREALNYCINHDPHSSCRAEAIRAASTLGLILEDTSFKDSIFTSLSIDNSPLVKREAEGINHKIPLISSCSYRLWVDVPFANRRARRKKGNANADAATISAYTCWKIRG